MNARPALRVLWAARVHRAAGNGAGDGTPAAAARADTTYHVAEECVSLFDERDGTNFPKKGSTVRIHYVGTFPEDGKKFDSSRARNRPIEFKLGFGQVIQGFDEAIAKMSKNQIAKLTISPDYGYGARGYPPIIPPHQTLVFEVELISFAN